MFTKERILALCPHAHADLVAAIAPALELHAPGFEVVAPLRCAHLMAQLAHESAGFTRLEEDLDYSAGRIPAVWPRLAPRAAELAHKPEALANAAYADRLGNGSEESGDGWRYRGRGLIQVTGRANYEDLELGSDPETAAEPAAAVRIALSFWRRRGCNEAADRDEVEAVTRLINGAALEGIVDRRDLTARAKTIFTPTTDLIA